MARQGLERIQYASKQLNRLFFALIIVLPVLNLWYWFSFNSLPPMLIDLPVDVKREVSTGGLFLAFLLSLLPLGVVVFGLITLRRLFRLYEKGIVFSKANVNYIRRLGHVLLLWVLASMLFTTLIGLVVTYANPPGQRLLVVSLDLFDMTALISGAVVLLISWVMDEGRKLEDEQAHTI